MRRMGCTVIANLLECEVAISDLVPRTVVRPTIVGPCFSRSPPLRAVPCLSVSAPRSLRCQFWLDGPCLCAFRYLVIVLPCHKL